MSTNIESKIEIISPIQNKLFPKEGSGVVVLIETFRKRWDTDSAEFASPFLLLATGAMVVGYFLIHGFDNNSNYHRYTQPQTSMTIADYSTGPKTNFDKNFLKLYPPFR